MLKRKASWCVFLTLLLFGSSTIITIPELTGSKNVFSHGAISYMSTFNVDGDLSLSSDQHVFFWKPHMIGSPSAEYNITFDGETVLYVKNVAQEKGYIAAGAWFDRAFVPLGRKVPVERDIYIEFDAMLELAEYEPNEWFRIAIANKLHKPFNDLVIYVELDFWDSLSTYSGPIGGVVYQDENTTKLHMDQIPMGIWRHYQFNLYEIMKNLTKSTTGRDYPLPENFSQLVASYIVVEYDKVIVEAKLHIKNFKLSKSIEPELPIPHDEASLLNYIRTFAPADIPIVKAPDTPPLLTNALPPITIDGKQLLANDTPITLKGGGDDYKSILEDDWIFDHIGKYPNFNVMRLSFRMIMSVDSPHSSIDFTLLDQVLAKLESMGVYAVLDAHHYWLPLVYEDLWIQQWIEIAKHYKNSTVVVAYELCNEPLNDYSIFLQRWLDWDLIIWKTDRSSYAYLQSIDEIRKTDLNKPIILNVQAISSELLPQIASISNIILTHHEWTIPKNLEEAQEWVTGASLSAVAIQNQSNVPIWLGEYGIFWEQNVTIQDHLFKTWTNIAKVNEWSYSFWMLLDTHYLTYWDDLFL